MIKVKLKELMDKHDMTTSDLVRKSNNELHRNTISNLLNDKVKGIQFETLEHLCHIFKCQTVDIIEFVPTDNRNL
ncbi:putative transcriptional regulator [Gracilibacillus ureilyticus]|uniref:Putative transcriptional regulator n=1 Tax=Gracilibacillus ureilyticus TaxID=531814 RepID=A0A1H9LBT6_9BACI|nr:putative transcriptional regulator [Gracilibacillus ureilyticus]